MKLCTSFMSTIMNNLLDVRKMEEGKMKLNKHPTCISECLKSVQAMLSPSVQSGVVLTTDCQTAPLTDWMLADSHRLQQVYTNVITNAIKYTKKGSIKLVFYWDPSDGSAVFECHDTGPGIPKSQQEELFKRFVQRGGAPGTGLGLAIAKHLVDLANGSIQFISDPMTKPGTVCSVRCPFKKCAAPAAILTSSTPTLSSEPIKEALRVLIVDDVCMNRTILSKRIIKWIAPIAAIKEAKNGEEALDICEKESFDVIFVDQFLEESGGVLLGTELVQQMRVSAGVEALIIGCSGNEIAEQFIQVGCQYVWGKPMPSNEEALGQLRRGLEASPFRLQPGRSWSERAEDLGSIAGTRVAAAPPAVTKGAKPTYHHS